MDKPESHVELSRRAARDLKKLQKRDRDRVAEGLDRLRPVPMPEHADVKPIVGHAPWMELRIGDHRVLYRPLSARELERHAPPEARSGFLLERIVDRQYLERAIRRLEVDELL